MQRCARRESPPAITTRPDSSISGRRLSGIGGAGKSAVRLAEDGWLVAAHRGRFDLAAAALPLV